MTNPQGVTTTTHSNGMTSTRGIGNPFGGFLGAAKGLATGGGRAGAIGRGAALGAVTGGPIGGLVGGVVGGVRDAMKGDDKGKSKGKSADKGSGGGEGGGGTYLCTVAHEYGWIDDDTLMADWLAGQAVPTGLYNWYASWAPQWANVCRRSKLARAVTLPIVTIWANSMAAMFRMRVIQ